MKRPKVLKSGPAYKKKISLHLKRLKEIVAYCEPHQEYMWAKYITALAKGKKEWRD